MTDKELEQKKQETIQMCDIVIKMMHEDLTKEDFDIVDNYFKKYGLKHFLKREDYK